MSKIHSLREHWYIWIIPFAWAYLIGFVALTIFRRICSGWPEDTVEYSMAEFSFVLLLGGAFLIAWYISMNRYEKSTGMPVKKLIKIGWFIFIGTITVVSIMLVIDLLFYLYVPPV